jgi:WD40 repeat protein
LGKLAAGNVDGSVFIYDTTSKGYKFIKSNLDNSKTEVIDLQWDPLSDNYLLVAYKNGAIKLLDTDSGQDVFVYEVSPTGVSAIRWVANVPGEFLSADARTGIVKMWNVSQKY